MDYYKMYIGAIGALEDLRGGEDVDKWLEDAWDNDTHIGYETTVKMVREILANHAPKVAACPIVSYNILMTKPIAKNTKIQLIKAVREATGLGLRGSKALADSVTQVAGVLVNLTDKSVATELAITLLRLGESVQIEKVNCEITHK